MTTAETRQRATCRHRRSRLPAGYPARTWTTSQCDGHGRTPNRQICAPGPAPSQRQQDHLLSLPGRSLRRRGSHCVVDRRFACKHRGGHPLAAQDVHRATRGLCGRKGSRLWWPMRTAACGESLPVGSPQLAEFADYLAKLVVRGGVEPPAFRFSGASVPSLHVAGRGLMGHLAAQTMARCRLTWPDARRRWLPFGSPESTDAGGGRCGAVDHGRMVRQLMRDRVQRNLGSPQSRVTRWR